MYSDERLAWMKWRNDLHPLTLKQTTVRSFALQQILKGDCFHQKIWQQKTNIVLHIEVADHETLIWIVFILTITLVWRHWQTTYILFSVQGMYFLSSLRVVAVHHHHPGGEGADHRSVPGLSLPGGQHLLAAVVSFQPAGHLAAPWRPLPDLLRHVRLHGLGLRRWA